MNKRQRKKMTPSGKCKWLILNNRPIRNVRKRIEVQEWLNKSARILSDRVMNRTIDLTYLHSATGFQTAR